MISQIEVACWNVVRPLSLLGLSNVPGSPADVRVFDFSVALHRWHELWGAAVLQLSVDFGASDDRRVVPLPDVLVPMLDNPVGVNGKDCGVLHKVRIAIRPGVQDAEVLQSHVDVVKADDLFIAADGLSWADLIGEGAQDGPSE